MFESINDKEDEMSDAHSASKQTKISWAFFKKHADSLSYRELDEDINASLIGEICQSSCLTQSKKAKANKRFTKNVKLFL